MNAMTLQLTAQAQAWSNVVKAGTRTTREWMTPEVHLIFANYEARLKHTNGVWRLERLSNGLIDSHYFFQFSDDSAKVAKSQDIIAAIMHAEGLPILAVGKHNYLLEQVPVATHPTVGRVVDELIDTFFRSRQ